MIRSGKVSGSARANGRGHGDTRRQRRVDGRGHRNRRARGNEHTDITLDSNTKDSILAYGLSSVGFGDARQKVSKRLNMERFRGHFGVGPKAIAACFKDLKAMYKNEKLELKHFMMTVCWLKLYETGSVMAGRWDHCEDFCRNTVKGYAVKIQALKRKKIKFCGFHQDRIYLATIDCVHCMCNEFRTDPHSKWYSHKHNGAGVSYEIAVDVDDDRAVWTAGPYPASTHDITIFRGGKKESTKQRKNEKMWDKNALYFQIPEGKKLIGDSGYTGEPEKISTTMKEHDAHVKEFFARAKSRHETFNTRLKFFGVLSGRFRHGKGADDKLKQHKTCFEAVCVLVQYDMENGHPLMEI